ncbi:hypothetical protein PBRA_000409 [Plasmodiophora brassicae]|uniref:Uncharacterized protein n=1 Tax=Plasmodiophora brassicae TaxID=37360 RepID=A0A0G4IHH3_PLABS|nr:hypothetical protein PBRA_000409 [Plasmodiophora brassicae]
MGAFASTTTRRTEASSIPSGRIVASASQADGSSSTEAEGLRTSADGTVFDTSADDFPDRFRFRCFFLGRGGSFRTGCCSRSSGSSLGAQVFDLAKQQA